jgi:hypothetical protein
MQRVSLAIAENTSTRNSKTFSAVPENSRPLYKILDSRRKFLTASARYGFS